MKRSAILFAVAFGLILATGWFLTHIKSFQRLGQPGVKVVDVPSYSEKGVLVSSNSVFLPAKILDYESEIMPVANVVLSWLPKDTTYGQRLYKAADGFEAAMNVVLMGSDRTSIHKPKYCLTGMGWENLQFVPDKIMVQEPHPYELPVMRIASTRMVKMKDGVERPLRSVFVYWFVADKQLTAEHGERMWWMARDMMFSGVLQRWAYVSSFSICLPGAEEATYQRMAGLIAAAVPRFQLATGEIKQARLE